MYRFLVYRNNYKNKGDKMTIPYSEDYLREMYVELAYDEIMTYYEFIDRVNNGQLAIETERLDDK